MNIADRILHGDALTVDYTDAWLELLRDIGVDHPNLDQLRELRDELDRLTAVAAEIALVEPAGPATTPTIASDTPTAEDALKAVKRSKAPSHDEIDAALRAMNERITATTRAYTAGFDRFTRSELIASITPHHDNLVDRAAELAAPFPDGLATDDDARLGGRLAEWAELGELLNDLDNLRRLVGSLRELAYLASAGSRTADRYLTAEFHYRDVNQALPYLAWNTRVGHARALQHGKPELLRVQDIDSIRSRTPDLPARDEDAHFARLRRQKEVDAWTASARRSEELQRMREQEEQMTANSRARMARR